MATTSGRFGARTDWRNLLLNMREMGDTTELAHTYVSITKLGVESIRARSAATLSKNEPADQPVRFW